MTRLITLDAVQVLEKAGKLRKHDAIRTIRGDGDPPYEPSIGSTSVIDLARGHAPMADGFRLLTAPDDARPLSDLLSLHGFHLDRDHNTALAPNALPRAVLQEALVTGGRIGSWRGFVVDELGPGLDMPGLRDAADVDRGAVSLRRPDGSVGPVPVSEVACDWNLWATPGDVATWLATALRGARTSPKCMPGFRFAWRVPGDTPTQVWRGDDHGLTSRIVLMPEIDLAVFLWTNESGSAALEQAFETILGAFWPAPGVEHCGHIVDTQKVVRRRRPESTPPTRRPRTFRGGVAGLGQLEVQLTPEVGGVLVRLDGETLEITEAWTDRGFVEVSCAVPVNLMIDGAADGRMVVLAETTFFGRLRGVIALEATGRHRLPRWFDLRRVDGR